MRPALERDIHKFYAALVKKAEQDEETGMLVYEGSPTQLYKELGINPSYYTPIRKILLKTECITILQQGNRAQPTVWILNHEPPAQDSWPDDLTGDQVSATLRADFERRIAALEAWRENLTTGGLNISEVFRNFESRISTLESELHKSTQGGKKGGTK